jgi:hypothetical protein
MSSITESARGEDCQIRMPGVCNFDPDTTVFCHLGGAGWALKSNDIHGAYGCYECHLITDGAKSHFTRDEIKLMFYDGMVRTQLILIEKGLIKV